jgi:transcriptional regulator with XRE-family HTH domain
VKGRKRSFLDGRQVGKWLKNKCFNFGRLLLNWFRNKSKNNFPMNLFFENAGYDLDSMAGRPPTKEATDFGKRLAAARKLRGLTQAQLGSLIGESQKMVDYFERRGTNVKSNVVKRLADALKVSADELLGIQPLKSRPGPKAKLLQQFEHIHQLPKSDQELVVRLLNRFLGNGNGHKQAA